MDKTDDEKVKLALKVRLIEERTSYFRASRDKYALIAKFRVGEKEKPPAEQMKTATINFISDCEDEWLAMSLEKRPMRDEFAQLVDATDEIWLKIREALKFVDRIMDSCLKSRIHPEFRVKAKEELQAWYAEEEDVCRRFLEKAGLGAEGPLIEEDDDELDQTDQDLTPFGGMALVFKETLLYINQTCAEAADNKEAASLDWMNAEHVLTECWKLWCAVRADMQSYNKVFKPREKAER